MLAVSMHETYAPPAGGKAPLWQICHRVRLDAPPAGGKAPPAGAGPSHRLRFSTPGLAFTKVTEATQP